MQLRRAEQPHPVVRARNPKGSELWLPNQRKRHNDFDSLLEGKIRL